MVHVFSANIYTELDTLSSLSVRRSISIEPKALELSKRTTTRTQRLVQKSERKHPIPSNMPGTLLERSSHPKPVPMRFQVKRVAFTAVYCPPNALDRMSHQSAQSCIPYLVNSSR
jgi:hypothetical protein